MDDRTRSEIVSWRASTELRQRVVDRRIARAEAAEKTWGEGRGLDVAETGDGVLFLGEHATRHPDNPVRFLDLGFESLATSPSYLRARHDSRGLEPARVVASALKRTHERNRAVREANASRDAERARARRRAERSRVKAEKKKRAAAESARVRLAAERAAAAALAAANAPPRWRRVKAVGNFIRRKARFGAIPNEGKQAEGS
jgi:hypothetical protein